MRQLVLFQTGNIEFAMDRDSISRIRPLPGSPTGTTDRVRQQPIEVEGRNLLLIDLAAAANTNATASYPPDAEMIVVKTSPLALLADQVKRTLDVNGERMDELPPVFGGTARACFPKVLHFEDQVVLVIDPDALVDVETYAAALRARPENRGCPTDVERETPHTDRTPQPMQTSSDPTAGDPLEAVVGKKLGEIIGRRVRKAVSQTMARALEQQLH